MYLAYLFIHLFIYSFIFYSSKKDNANTKSSRQDDLWQHNISNFTSRIQMLICSNSGAAFMSKQFCYSLFQHSRAKVISNSRLHAQEEWSFKDHWTRQGRSEGGGHRAMAPPFDQKKTTTHKKKHISNIFIILRRLWPSCG